MTDEEILKKLYKSFPSGATEQYKVLAAYKEGFNRLAKLEKENIELKKRNGELAGQKASLERWFGEAIRLIKDLLTCCRNYPQENAEKMYQAEQFLSEVKE